VAVSNSSRRTAVIVDRQPLLVLAAEQVVARLGVVVVAKTSALPQALTLIEHHQPDLVIAGVDVGEGQIEGLRFLRQARRLAASARLVALSDTKRRSQIDQAFAAGAAAYVLKSARPDELAVAIRQAFVHSVYFPTTDSSEETRRLRAAPEPEVVDAPPSQPDLTQPDPPQPNRLTTRELEILRYAADGASNAQIAGRLWVTEQTVKFHLTNVYRKLGVANRTEASRWAQLNGVLSVSEPPEVNGDQAHAAAG
jgi:DNA-binding NarL/FixJ family response regulator